MNNQWNYRKLICFGLMICFSFCMQASFCQALQTFTNKKDILIGEQIKLTIKYTATGTPVKWLVFPDTIPHFEIVDVGKPDTTMGSDQSITISQTLLITSFDSGKWIFPSFPIALGGILNQPTAKVQTDSFLVNVSYAPPDSTNQLRDIKPIIQVSVTDYYWIYVIGGVLLLLLLLFLLYRYFKKKKASIPNTISSGLSPFDEALVALKTLAQYDLQDAAEIKQFHVKLANIFKHYIGRKSQKNIFNKTTGDLMIHMSNFNLTAESMSQLATALRCTDAVKFAKYLPDAGESGICLQEIKETICIVENLTKSTKS